MSSYKRPGVYVEEVLKSYTAGGFATADAVAAFLGATARGPVTPTLVNSWADFSALFGGFDASADLAFAVYTYFGNGGGPCYVSRVASNTAAVASRTLTDQAGTPLSTLRIDAANPGTWGQGLFLDVVVRGNRFDLVVKFGSAAATSVVERHLDLSMASTDERYAPSLINRNSRYVVATDMLSATAAPANNPSAQTGTALTGGSNGAALASADWTRTLNSHDVLQEPLVVNLAGVTDATTNNLALTWANGNGRAFVVCDLAKGLTAATAITAAASLTATSYGAAYWPWVQVPDPTKSGRATRLTAPGGAVVGTMIATDSRFGPYKTPAGLQARVAGAVAVERLLTDSELDDLNSANAPVNAIRPVPGGGICIMGGRTLLPGRADKYVANRRSLIYLRKSLQDLTQFAVFEPNNASLWSALRDQCTTFLEEYRAKGGLRGSSSASAYYVRCDATNNTLSSIEAGTVNVEVGVALQYPAEFVVIKIGQYEGGSSAVES